MGFNPFIDDFPVESADEWVGDQTLIEILRNSAGTRTNTYIVGPEGSGKTSLLRTAFTPEYRRKMAETRKKLIYFADLSNKSDGNDICEYLADRLKLSLNQLIRDRELLSEIHELTGEISAMPGQARFQNFMQVLHDNWGYMAVIIMDYFELFTMSNSVTQAHHDCLRSLIESGQIQCVVATNYDLSKDYILESVDGILKRLRTDYLDMLLLHRPDALVEPEEVAAAFDILEKSGKVRMFGVSNHKPIQIELLKRYVRQEIVTDQLQFSIPVSNMVANGMEVNMETEGSADRDGSALDYCRLNDITIQAWSPFQMPAWKGCFFGNEEYADLNKVIGELAGQYGVSPTAIAAAWILRHPAHMQIVTGTASEERLTEIIDAGRISLSREEWYRLYLAAGHILP